MELTTHAKTILHKILELMASSQSGQFIIKKIDDVLGMLRQSAKYCADGECKDRKLWWPVFWTVLIYMQIFRVVYSMISADPIESKDIVSTLQTWQRTLRYIRFGGLRKMNEGKDEANGSGDRSCPTRRQSSTKRRDDEMLDFNLLDDLVNRTFSDSDDLDSTYTIDTNGVTSMICSSNDQSFSEDYQSPLKFNNRSQPESASESKHRMLSFKSNDFSFESTDELAFMMTSQGSASSPKQSHTKSDSNGESNRSVPTAGKESPTECAEAMISDLVQMKKEGKTKFRINGLFQPAKKHNSKSHNDVKKLSGGVTKRKNRPGVDGVGHQVIIKNPKSGEKSGLMEKRN